MCFRNLILIIILLSLTMCLQAQDSTEVFWNASRANDVKTMKAFLDKGFNVNTKNRYGVTALTFAADKGNLEAVSLLLERGADPNLKDSFYGETPLGWAIYKKKNEIIKCMINHGGDISNAELVMGAAGAGLADVVKLLLEKGAPGAENVLMASISGNDSTMFDITFGFSKKSDSLLSLALVEATAQKNEKFIARLKAAGAKLPEKTAEQPAGKIDENLVGTFKTKEMNKAELAITDGVLTGSFDGSPAFKLKPVTDSTFIFNDIPGISLSVQRVAGQVTGISLIQPGRTGVYQKITVQAKSSASTVITEDNVKVEKPSNWPSFRGRQAMGTADGQHPPLTWDAIKETNLVWKTFLPGLAHASPVIWDNNVFLITAQSSDTASEYRVGLFGDVEPANDNSSHIWKIYCLDKQTGKIKWEKKAYEGIPRVKRHIKASQANATPVTNGEYVAALFGSEGLVCYDFKGNELWRKDLGVLDAGWFFNEDTQWGPASSPVIYNNTVIVQCDRSKDSYIAAFDLKTGQEVWKTMRDEISSWGTPTVYNGKTRDELVTNASHFIRGYNPATGEELWRLSPNSEVTVGTPVFTDSLIFVTAGYPPIQPVYAIKPGGMGNISIADSLNNGEFIKWRKKRGGTYMPTPITYGGYLYTLSNNGQLICYEASTGEIKYKEIIKGGNAFTASPVAADGKIYCTSEEKGVFVIKAGPEYELITSNPVDEICMATPAISGGFIFVRGQHHIFCFGIKR